MARECRHGRCVRASALDPHAVIERLDPGAELSELFDQRRDAIALLHPQLGRITDLARARGERGGDREHRKLVDDGLVAVDHGSVERRVLHHEIGNRLAAAFGTWVHRDRRAHGPEHIEVREPTGIGQHVFDHQARTGRERGGDHEERGRRRIAGDVERERVRRARVDAHSGGVHDVDRHANRPQQALGVIAAWRGFDDLRGSLRLEAGEDAARSSLAHSRPRARGGRR